MRADKKTPLKADKKAPARAHKRGVIGYSKKSALLEDAITQMNAGKYGRSSAALKELLALDPLNMEARRLFATLHLRLGSLLPARQAFESLANEALERQDYWLAESLLREYLAAGPRCVPFIEKLGSVYQEKGDALAAAEEFAKAIDILIEDPDSDRPTRPAELYAKIRELAPASPPAFRLASLFDAQSGDLIARAPVAPAPQPEEASVPLASVESVEPSASILSTVMSDPVSGVMPWDDVPAETPVLPAQSSLPESQQQIATSTAALLEPTVEAAATPMAPPPVSETFVVQDSLHDRTPVEADATPSPSFSISASDDASSITLSHIEATPVPLTDEAMSSAVHAASDSEWSVASSPASQDSLKAASDETSGVAEAMQLTPSDSSLTLPGSTADPLPAPLPWEQVHDTTIAIPQPEVDPLLSSYSSVESAPAVLSEATPSDSGHSQGTEEQVLVDSTLLAGVETTLSSVTTQEYSPDVAWSAPDVSVIDPGSSPSVSPEPPLISSPVTAGPSDTVIESVPPPLPWEQVQESSVSPVGSSVESTGAVPHQPQAVTPFDAHVTPEAITIAPELGDMESRDMRFAPTADVPTQSEPPSAPGQSQKVGEFSWASIFNSTWKFGSSSPAPHDSLQHVVPIEPQKIADPVVDQQAAIAPLAPEELVAGITSDQTSESMAVSTSSVAGAVAPLPWEQIQDVPVTIPSAEIATGSVIEAVVEAPAVQDIAIEITDGTAIQRASVVPSSIQGDLTPAADLAEVPESIRESASSEAAIPSPIPWEQIQDAPVTIPSTEMESSSVIPPMVESPAMAVTPIEVPDEAPAPEASVIAPVHQEEFTTDITTSESTVASSTSWEQIQDMSVAITSTESALNSVVQSQVDPPVMPVNSLEEATVHNSGQGISPAPESAVSADVRVEESHPREVTPVESVEPKFRIKEPQPDSKLAVNLPPVEGRRPDHSEEFRTVSEVEPPVVGKSGKPDEPASSPAPILAAPPTTESAPPVLPQELLPVLQTLVDQLSVVTKTIPAISAETKTSEPVSRGQEVLQETTSLREPSQSPTSAELVANPASAQMPPTEEGPPSQWKTGEVAVQTHRPSTKKRKHLTDQAPEPPPPPVEEQSISRVEPVMQMSSTVAEAAMPAPVKEKEEWIRTGEAIRFVDPKVTEPTHLNPPPPAAQEEWRETSPAASTAASAVDVLFHSSGSHTRTQTIERTAVPKPRPRISAKLARVRIGLSVFVGSCFSTTRALIATIVGLAVLCVAMLAVVIGAVGLSWLVMEEKPSSAFQSLTTTPQRAMMDSSKNGYLLLLGFEADPAADPVQAGYERKPDRKDGELAAVCQGGDEGMTGTNQKNASASVAQGWYRTADPAGQFKAQADSLKGWMSQGNASITRYRQWLKMPFDDWGYGQSVTPPCAAILFAHRLHVAEGFSQGASMEAGVERLESDMEAWRTTLGQAKTLPIKMMALQAISDDIAVASGLLVKPDFDGKALPRITKMLRPLDPVESSMRWPMQSQLVLATKSYEAQLDADRGEDVPLHVRVASMLPLPKQRRFNDYAAYYEASYKAAGEGRYGAMPKRSTYIRQPANGVMDYLTNPIENIIGIDPLPAWDHYNGLVIDTDAHLRLASLQAWLRRGPQDADLLARIAKAGQRFYDPYTGLPMLVNLRGGVMYSVGHDGKDQDADPQQDVVVSIPLNQPMQTLAKPAPKSK